MEKISLYVLTLFITKDHSFSLGFEQYLKEAFCVYNKIACKNKVDIAYNLVELFYYHNPYKEHVAYILADSWFTSKKPIQKSLDHGYHLISGFKTNRSIYP